MLQFIRFLRRTEGVEAARKYFLDARKSPNCTYHVYVAYAMMAFCLDKDPKVLFSFLVLIFMYSVFIYKMVLHIDMVGYVFYKSTALLIMIISILPPSHVVSPV